MSRPREQPRFALDTTSGVPFYKQVILQVEMAVADGRLTRGDRLPTVRGLAVELNVNPNTVSHAYNEMEVRGIVTTQQGSGTFISDRRLEMPQVERERVLAGITRSFVTQAGSHGFTIAELLEAMQELGRSP